ncbi:hypothetical protein VTK26DRAFT_115 [Humicola hyalothermophila]
MTGEGTKSIVVTTTQASKEPTSKPLKTTKGPSPVVQVDEGKPKRLPPARQPEVWANKRGSLCEALPYFRAYQGSLHSCDLVAQGFLIDQEVDNGDVFGADIIISSVGGGRVKNRDTGTMIRARDAKDDASNVKAFRNAYQNKTLVAVIAGENHPFYPCEPPHPYAVLGYFHITDMWKEKQVPKGAQTPVTIWRIRFEKANLAEPSWWISEDETTSQMDASYGLTIKTPAKTCDMCGISSKEIFTAGWFCLNHECKSYYVFPTGESVDLANLAYTTTFMSERTLFEGEIPSVKPPVPSHEGLHGTELAVRRGFKEEKKFDITMEKRREHWGVNHNPLEEAGRIHDPIATHYNRGFLPYSQTLNEGGHLIRQYFLNDASGRVLGSFSIFSSNQYINAQPGGPDELFRSLELTDIGLRRNPAAVVGHKLEGFTRHFQQNFGARYKFGVTVQSKGFSEAPDSILRGLYRLIWAKHVALRASNAFIEKLPANKVGLGACPTDVKDFNELLALGYMEQDKINYHDDGEHELGPVVAALSLGSPSTMRFRPKMGKGFQYTTHTERQRTVYAEMLEVPMKHGDMMVMIGTEIQKFFEHTVDPYGSRRFSLTARYIDPEKMTLQEDKDDAAVKGAIPAHAKTFEYYGN